METGGSRLYCGQTNVGGFAQTGFEWFEFSTDTSGGYSVAFSLACLDVE